MKFLIVIGLALTLAICALAKTENKKLDLTTISKPVPKSADPEVKPEETEADGEASPAATTVITKEGYTKIDLKPFNEVNKPIKTNSTATVKCRASTGIQYLPTDSGFESCLKQNEIEKSRAANREGQPARNADQTPGQSVEFSFGENN
mgnify:CR=1 FL=1|tara:strand:- start:12754 stop:13200 length:447 start_codon:yes stop_codon:yes gene_type:complete